MQQKKLSLYDRIGGIFSISDLVNHFSDALIVNPIVGKESKNQFLRNWNQNQLGRLSGLKWMRTLWLADLSGGPYKFIPTKPGKCPFSLENAHLNLQISPEEFDEVIKELKNSLESFKVPAQETLEVLQIFMAHKNEVNQGFYVLNKQLNVPNITCPVFSRFAHTIKGIK